jgi:hypothetical protein
MLLAIRFGLPVDLVVSVVAYGVRSPGTTTNPRTSSVRLTP